MRFNELLAMVGLDPRNVAIMLHTPAQPDQKRSLLALVEDAPDQFDAYQDNHPRNAESTLKKRAVTASFVVGEGGESRFVGLYTVAGWTFRSAEEFDADPVRQNLILRFRGISHVELARQSGQSGRAVFDLRPLPALADLRGRLIVSRPPGRAYMRLAENCDLPVLQIEREARFAPPAPDWDNFVVTGGEMRGLPRTWQARLREWRGIYLIVDQSDGARYVGSAYGAENLLGRWRAHVAREQGVTVELGSRDPAMFRFSILQRLDPDLAPDQVIAVEQNWKRRLDTIAWGLNRN